MADNADRTPRTSREVERKLRVHALFRLPDVAGPATGVQRVQQEPTRSMRAVYHDTADLRLFRWGVTMRRREGGPDEGWHVKLPVAGADAGVRDELHLPLSAGAVGQVPAQLVSLVTALAREAPLGPVAELRTERTPYLLFTAGLDRPVAELVDDTVSIMDGERVAARFREIEIEELPGPDEHVGPAVLAAVADLLVGEGAVPGSASKASHALGPRASAPPDVVERPAGGPQDPAADAVRAHLAKHVRRLLLQDLRVRRDLPDSVHQMRVAARRLRSALKTFAPLVDAEWAAHLRAELGWAAGELGAIRDTEVLMSKLDAHAADLPAPHAAAAAAAVHEVLGERIAAARAEALEALDSDRHRALLVDLVAAVHHPQFTSRAHRPDRREIPPLLARATRRLARDVARLDPDGAAAPWHRTRIEAKRARYAAELAVPVFGEEAQELASALEQVTELLGDHQDCHVAQIALVSIAADPRVGGSAGFALGLLHEQEVAREMALRRLFLRKWPAIEARCRAARLR